MTRCVSLCTGYGGLEMGLADAYPDLEVVAVAESDPHAAVITEHHHPKAPNLGDITTIHWPTIVRLNPDIK